MAAKVICEVKNFPWKTVKSTNSPPNHSPQRKKKNPEMWIHNGYVNVNTGSLVRLACSIDHIKVDNVDSFIE